MIAKIEIAPDSSAREPRLRLRKLSPAIVLVGLATIAFVVGAVIGLLAPDNFLAVPAATNGSWSDAADILRANLPLLVVIAACAGLQPLAREEVRGGSRPTIKWITTTVVACFVVMNVGATGVVVGHLGLDAVLRILPHAPFEIAGFALAIYAFLLARTGDLSRKRAIQWFSGSAGLLVLGAIIESFISGGLS